MSKEREYLLQAANILSDFTEYDKFASTIYERLAQPDINTQYLLDQVSRLIAENAMLKEKWSAPKRYPLTDEDICEILLKKEWKGFVDLVRIIEKVHGIGGGE